MKNNQNGVSLIRVLAAIVITSFILILAWSIFFQGSNYSNKSISKSFMQQEANVIVTKLKKIHQTYDSYTVNIIDCSVKITQGGAQVEEFKNDKLCIELTGITPGVITPANPSSLKEDFTLKITDKENLLDQEKSISNENLKDISKLIEINSSLYRLK